MSQTIFLGRDKQLIKIPQAMWEQHLAQVPEHMDQRLAFMTPAHHQVRYYVVREMPRIGKAIRPERIAADLNLSIAEVTAILDDLEKNLTFLFRGEGDAVSWAYPVTVQQTPHTITFSSGEQLYGAWGEDAIATPFVQGRLREEALTFNIETSCACCDRPLNITMDDRLNFQLAQQEATPLIFSPEVDWANFTEPNIIHAYWMKSIFFWSEEHARAYRTKHNQVNGQYLTLEQMAFLTPISQGGLFNWL